MPVAGDRVDAGAVCSCRPPTGSTARPEPLQRPLRKCSESSTSKTASALATKRAAPSGCRQAPRAATCSTQRASCVRVIARLPVRDLLEPACERGKAVDAGAALSGALVGEIARDPRALANTARRRRERDDDASAETVRGCQRAFCVASPAAEVPTDEIGARHGSVGPAGLSNEFAVPRAELHLVDAGSSHCPRQCDQRGPGSAAVPSERNHRAPKRETSARCASVSAFCTSVGAPPRPLSNGYGGFRRGFAGRPSSAFRSADSSPTTKPSGTEATRQRPAIPPLLQGCSERAPLVDSASADGDDDIARADRAAAAAAPSSTR